MPALALGQHIEKSAFVGRESQRHKALAGLVVIVGLADRLPLGLVAGADHHRKAGFLGAPLAAAIDPDGAQGHALAVDEEVGDVWHHMLRPNPAPVMDIDLEQFGMQKIIFRGHGHQHVIRIFGQQAHHPILELRDSIGGAADGDDEGACLLVDPDRRAVPAVGIEKHHTGLDHLPDHAEIGGHAHAGQQPVRRLPLKPVGEIVLGRNDDALLAVELAQDQGLAPFDSGNHGDGIAVRRQSRGAYLQPRISLDRGRIGKRGKR